MGCEVCLGAAKKLSSWLSLRQAASRWCKGQTAGFRGNPHGEEEGSSRPVLPGGLSDAGSQRAAAPGSRWALNHHLEMLQLAMIGVTRLRPVFLYVMSSVPQAEEEELGRWGLLRQWRWHLPGPDRHCWEEEARSDEKGREDWGATWDLWITGK